MTTDPPAGLRTRLSRPLPAFIGAALVIPLVLMLAAVIVQVVLLSRLPDRVAVHWSVDGRPDGWLPGWTSPLLTAVVVLIVSGLLAVPALPALRDGDRGPSYRLLAALSAGLAAFTVVPATGALWYQTGDRGVAGDQVPIEGLLLTATLAAVAVGAAAWWIQPEQKRPPENSLPVPAHALAPGERPVWLRTATAGRGMVAVTVGVFAVMLVSTCYLWLSDAGTGTVVGGAVLTVLITAAATVTLAFRVRVDEDGVQVASLAGRPRFTVPIDDVEQVRLIQVSPNADFGGYGIRLCPGVTGIIVRRGPALEVLRRSGRRFVVTVDDAVGAAALLTALAERRPDDDPGADPHGSGLRPPG
ncbi:DUF1648 domain-containing protein [Gordonia sp. VNK21]|uniref:DUF1648 domain-containing protein n=1 Tax=Gordonia sp. VNK21 TaxID=3382483 RepID=UPI0038D3874C